MDVKDIERRRRRLNSQKFHVFNPLSEDFEFTFNGKMHTIKACKSARYFYSIRQHAVKKLVERMMINSGKENDPKLRESFEKRVAI